MQTKLKLYRVCAWCDFPAFSRTRAAESRGYAVTHGMCDTCYEKQTGEKAENHFVEGPTREVA